MTDLCDHDDIEKLKKTDYLCYKRLYSSGKVITPLGFMIERERAALMLISRSG